MENRAELLKQKLACDEELAKLKSDFTQAKAIARNSGKYMLPQEYARMELKVAHLKAKSQSLQLKLSTLPRQANINDCFRDAAKKILSEKDFLIILELAHDYLRDRCAK